MPTRQKLLTRLSSRRHVKPATDRTAQRSPFAIAEDQRARSRAQEPRTRTRAHGAKARGARIVLTPQYRAQTHEELVNASLQLPVYGAAPDFLVADIPDRK